MLHSNVTRRIIIPGSGGCKGGRGTRAPSWGSKFFQFHAVLKKNFQNCILAPPGELAPPPWGNPGSATAGCVHGTHKTTVSKIVSKNCSQEYSNPSNEKWHPSSDGCTISQRGDANLWFWAKNLLLVHSAPPIRPPIRQCNVMHHTGVRMSWRIFSQCHLQWTSMKSSCDFMS